jgi:hypothetical protein
MRKVTAAAALSVLSLLGIGCASHYQEGVKSDYLSQTTMVYADPETTTNAAKQVFSDDGLTDVSATSTKVDGRASGLMADKTKVQATIDQADRGSKLTISVGTVGDPKMGAQWAAKIKQVAEGKNNTNNNTRP